MENMFVEMLSFQVKPEKTAEFESLLAEMTAECAQQTGCLGVRGFKRFFTFDGVKPGDPPRALTRVVKCVKYFVYWEFASIESCGAANGWLFANWAKRLAPLLIAPFEINSGFAV